MQSGADLLDPSWAGRRQPQLTPMPMSMAGGALPTADPHAYPVASAHSSSCSAESAIDLEAQNGSRLASHAHINTADMAAAVTNQGLRHNGDGSGSECGDEEEEPADVASERAKADRLWAARGGHSEGSTNGDEHSDEVANPAGPAILLHNLRKVCKAAQEAVWLTRRSARKSARSLWAEAQQLLETRWV